MDMNGNKVQCLLKQFEERSSESTKENNSLKPQPKARDLSRPSSNSNLAGMLKYGNRNGYIESENLKKSQRTFDSPEESLSAVKPHNRRNAVYIDDGTSVNNGEGKEESASSLQKEFCRANGDDNSSQRSSKSSLNESVGGGGGGDNSSTTGSVTGYNRVKRSNAFRQKDIVEGSTAPKSKMVIERVKSLDCTASTIPLGNNRESMEEAEYSSRLSAPQFPLPKSLSSGSVNPYQVSSLYSSQPGQTEVDYALPYSLHPQVYGSTRIAPGKAPPPPPQRNRSNYQQLNSGPKQSGYLPPYNPPPPPPPELRKGSSSAYLQVRSASSFPNLPPSKPPRTFLHDILSSSDTIRQSQYQNSIENNPLVSVPSNNKLGNDGIQYDNGLPPRFATVSNSISLANLKNLNSKGNLVLSQQQPHPVLVRSKTESQIMYGKSKPPSLRPATFEMDLNYVHPVHRHSSSHHYHLNNSGLPPPHYAHQPPPWTRGGGEPTAQNNNSAPPGKLINACGVVSKSDERLCEKSKSEWSLNQSLASSGRRNTISNLTTTDLSLDSSSTSSSKRTGGFQQSIQNFVNQLFSNWSKEATSSTDSGIGIQIGTGTESLSSCDTPVQDSTTDTGDSDCENELEGSKNARQVVESRKTYVRRVSSIKVQELSSTLPSSYSRMLFQNSKKYAIEGNLFECLLVVGLNRDPYRGSYHAYIREKFPPNATLAPGIEQFCFPDALEWPLHEGASAQFYTLAITNHKGSRKFGCCFRILPEGSNICIPITYCLIGSHRAIGFFKEILRELTQRHGINEYAKRHLLEDLYKKVFPRPGEALTVHEINIPDEIHSGSIREHLDSVNSPPPIPPPPKSIIFKRKADQRLEEEELVTLLLTLDINIVLKVFGSLLLERKVVLLGRALNTLSLCVEAFESLLCPFSWQHTFVPILPLRLTDVLDAPAPFLIGVLKSTQTTWDKTLDEGIVVDLDQNKVLSCVGDEASILPKRIHRKIRDALQLVMNLTEEKKSTKNVLISECFIRLFVEALGQYSDYIIQQDGMKIFERDAFVKSSESKAIQNFLEWFSETSMFHEFIEIRLKNKKTDGLFDQRVLEQENNHSHSNQHSSAKNPRFFLHRGSSTSSKQFGNWLKDFVK